MKTCKIKSCKANNPKIKTKTEVINRKGTIIEVRNVPNFDGPTVTVKGANSDEFWRKHPKNGDKIQKSMAAKLLAKKFEKNLEYARKWGFTSDDIAMLKNGQAPNGWELHHENTGGYNDSRIKLVRTNDHEQNPHKLGMLTGNKDRMNKEAEKQGTLPKNKLERMRNNTEFWMHKHPVATGTGVGVATTGVLCGGYAWVCKKLGRKPSNWGYAACTAIGIAAGVITHSKLNDGKIYL